MTDQLHDTGPGGDRDTPYIPGNPRGHLSTIEQARLLILRGLIMDYRHGEHGGPADGDLDYVRATATGLYVP